MSAVTQPTLTIETDWQLICALRQFVAEVGAHRKRCEGRYPCDGGGPCEPTVDGAHCCEPCWARMLIRQLIDLGWEVATRRAR